MAREALGYQIVDVDLATWEERVNRNRKYPWEKLEVGEAFVLPPQEAAKINIDSFRPQTCAAGSRLGRKFKSRLLPDGSIQVVRHA